MLDGLGELFALGGDERPAVFTDNVFFDNELVHGTSPNTRLCRYDDGECAQVKRRVGCLSHAQELRNELGQRPKEDLRLETLDLNEGKGENCVGQGQNYQTKPFVKTRHLTSYGTRGYKNRPSRELGYILGYHKIGTATIYCLPFSFTTLQSLSCPEWHELSFLDTLTTSLSAAISA